MEICSGKVICPASSMAVQRRIRSSLHGKFSNNVVNVNTRFHCITCIHRLQITRALIIFHFGFTHYISGLRRVLSRNLPRLRHLDDVGKTPGNLSWKKWWGSVTKKGHHSQVTNFTITGITCGPLRILLVFNLLQTFFIEIFTNISIKFFRFSF